MKIFSSFLSFSSATNYQGHRFLSGEKLVKRSDSCREKVDEATSNWNVENGEWTCPLYDSNHFKITCYPKCPDDSWKKNWKHSPYKKRPKIITTCGDPATYKLKNMEESTTFTCTQKPPHPCDIQVENINIENGEIEKIKIQNAVKAAYNIVCTGPQKHGQKTKITCTGSEPENTYWTAPKGPNNWRSVCEEEDLPEIDPDFSSLSGQITPSLLTCTQEENKIFAADNRLQFDQEAKIVGGVEAADNAWPWIVRLEFSDGEGGTSTCGGSVIANRWVLSAAHCCEGASGIRGFFGDLKIDEHDSSEYELQAINWVVHWEFGNNSDGSASNSDLCLVKFEEDILAADPEGKVGIACLPNKREEHGAACWVAGWGTTEYGGDGSNELLSVGVNILDHDYWNGMENSKFTSIGINSLLPDDICASKPDLDGDGFIDAGSDACQGDSGGPLICPVDGKATIVGVVSRGYGCAWKGYPGIYTSAFQLRFWIRKFIDRYGA